jgi:hypothetical protein
VPHQAQQGQAGRRDRPLLELADGQPGALEQQRVAMEVQPRSSAWRSPRMSPGSVRSTRGAVHASVIKRHGSCDRLSPSIP